MFCEVHNNIADIYTLLKLWDFYGNNFNSKWTKKLVVILASLVGKLGH